MKKIERVAIYGGTFNPPHIGHIRSAESLSKAINPDRLLIIPDFLPPHKEFLGKVSWEDRLNMCRLAFSHIKNAEISDIEIKRGGKSYTSYTLEQLTEPNRELYFLCGTDMFLTMSSWYRPEVIFKLSTICFVRRENDEEIYEKIKSARERYKMDFSAKIIEIPTDILEVSSTELRDSLVRGENTGLLTDSVFKYIRQRGIYL